MATRLGPSGIFQYNQSHGVLICRDCRYAIQKSALQSHLLRHKIYREDRQQLLDCFNQLNILEPDDVPLPDPKSPPIDGLEIISGFSCTMPGCERLCGSSKRMRLHQSEAHELGNRLCSSSSREVKLQTFFRGTKIRYFIVTPDPMAEATQSKRQNNPSQENDRGKNYEEVNDVQMDYGDPRCIISVKRPSFDPNEVSPAMHVDLETLNYFNQFIMITCHTLPLLRVDGSSVQSWQSDVIPLALQSQGQWFMCGALAIAAYHLAATAHSTDAKVLHTTRAKYLSLTFAMNHSKLDTPPEPVKEAARQVGSVLTCISLATNSESHSWNLHTFMGTVRTLVGIDATHKAGQLVPNRINLHNKPFNRARQVASEIKSHELSAMLDRLETLPARLSIVFGTPENIHDVVTTLAAMTFLVDRGALGFQSEHAPTVFEAMAIWVVEMPQHFHNMIERSEPPALVVFAHFVVLLVSRAEKFGCWFLEGVAQKMLKEIEDLLRPHGRAVSNLIAGLEIQ
ncbi:hypothetical protein DM02DRAFT_673660 [Periconia macrospinosa]|uniref:C2H2-type domain-containing protein n=1 Tax=Periconia macrospinosa TaxID=97972 RepID=A0A2V1DIN3_9PLEO|nr:hypothetical protein DM02DRAFT_673660 [Periconia macrospinosa]